MGCGIALGLKLDKIQPMLLYIWVMVNYKKVLIGKHLCKLHIETFDNLIAIIDRNKLQIDGCTEDVMAVGDAAAKIKAFGWEVVEIDGHMISIKFMKQLKKLKKQLNHLQS